MPRLFFFPTSAHFVNDLVERELSVRSEAIHKKTQSSETQLVKRAKLTLKDSNKKYVPNRYGPVPGQKQCTITGNRVLFGTYTLFECGSQLLPIRPESIASLTRPGWRTHSPDVSFSHLNKTNIEDPIIL